VQTGRGAPRPADGAGGGASRRRSFAERLRASTEQIRTTLSNRLVLQHLQLPIVPGTIKTQLKLRKVPPESVWRGSDRRRRFGCRDDSLNQDSQHTPLKAQEFLRRWACLGRQVGGELSAKSFPPTIMTSTFIQAASILLSLNENRLCCYTEV
jgi:hypothetical protein